MDHSCVGGQCVRSVKGPWCYCPFGYFGNDFTVCVGPQVAPACFPLIKRDDDKNRPWCLHEVPHNNFLFLFTITAIWRVDWLTGSQTLVIADLVNVTSISSETSYIYWHEEGPEPRICRLSMDTLAVEVPSLGWHNGWPKAAEGVALFLFPSNAYYTDITKKQIGVVLNYDLVPKRLVLITKDLDRPRSIIIMDKHLYWTDSGKKPHIGRSNMLGQEQRMLVHENLRCPDALTMDINKNLFWLDPCKGVLESLAFGSPNTRREVSMHDGEFSLSMSNVGSEFIWSSVYEQQKMSNESLLQKIDRVKCFFCDATPEEIIEGKKGLPQCGYAHLHNAAGAVSCWDEPTNRVMLQEEVFVGHKNTLTQLRIQRNAIELFHKIITYHVGEYTISRMAQDIFTGGVYIADNERHSIIKFFRNCTEEVEGMDIGQVSSMQISHHAHNLYWTDSQRGTLEVMSLEASNHRQIIRQFTSDVTPLGLHIGPFTGDLFVVTKNGSALNLVQLGQLEDTVFRLNATIAEHETLLLSGTECCVILSIGAKEIIWYVNLLEEKAFNELGKHVDQIFIRWDISGVYFTSNGSLWNDKDAEWFELFRNVSPSIQLIVNYEESIDMNRQLSRKEYYEKYPCLLDNGGCSDICNPANNSHAYCSCDHGRNMRDGDAYVCVNEMEYEDQQKRIIISRKDPIGFQILFGSITALVLGSCSIIAICRKIR